MLFGSLANFLLSFLVPTIERASPAIRNIGNALLTIESGGTVTVPVPVLGQIAISKVGVSPVPPQQIAGTAPAGPNAPTVL